MNSFKNALKYIHFVFSFATRKHKLLVYSFYVFYLLVSLQPQIQNYLISRLVDVAIESKNSFDTNLVLSVVFVTGSFLFFKVITDIREYLDRRWSAKLDHENSTFILENNLKQPSSTYEDPEFIKLKTKIQFNMYRANGVIDRYIGIVVNLIPVIFTVIVFYKYDFLAIILLLIAVLPELYFKIRYGARLWSIWDVHSEEKVKYSLYRDELYTNNPDKVNEIKVFKYDNFLLRRLQQVHEKFFVEMFKKENSRLRVVLISNIWEASFYGFSIYRVFLLLVEGDLTVGNFYFVLSLLLTLKAIISNEFSHIVQLLNDLPFYESFYKFLNFKTNIKINNGIETFDDEKVEIELKDVWFKYPGTNRWVLKGVNLKIPEGKDVALVGKNGSGKTTLIKLILGVYVVDKGQILINGKDIRTLKIDDYYKKIGLLSQEFVSCGIPAWENIYLGNVEAEENMDKIIEAAKSADADTFISKYPKGYDTFLTRGMEDGVIPSGGQLQRIAIARVFFRNPELILLDEPTSAIDALAEEEIFNNLKDFAKDKSVLIVSHRFATVKKADYIYVLDGGTIVEEGTHEKLAGKSGLYSKMYQAQES